MNLQEFKSTELKSTKAFLREDPASPFFHFCVYPGEVPSRTCPSTENVVKKVLRVPPKAFHRVRKEEEMFACERPKILPSTHLSTRLRLSGLH